MNKIKKKVVVINRSCPELNYVAAGLAKKGLLQVYIRPYANQGRIWEKALKRMPGINNIYKRTFCRRVLPKGIYQNSIKEIGVTDDILLSFFSYFLGEYGKARAKDYEERLYSKLRRESSYIAKRAEILIGPYNISEPAFSDTDGVKILNYPSTHHNNQIRCFDEEKELEPSFSSMLLPNWSLVAKEKIEKLDAEIRLADKILLGSTFAKDSFIAEGVQEQKLEVISYGTDTSLFHPLQNKYSDPEVKNFRVLFVGGIGQFKGISYLLKAYKQFKGPGTELVLIGNIIGDKTPLEPYKESFTHFQHMPRTELANFYQSADVFVFPTLHEGMGLVVLEAMASGLPVITTPNGPSDIVQDGISGFLVPVRNIEAIVEKLELLRTHPEERYRMGSNARKRALEFCWDNYEKRIVDLISRLS